MSLSPGARLGAYEVGVQIGVGGMGEVYRATDTKLKREVAIKVLPASVAVDPERLARFRREAEVLASLNHPNIAAIYGLEDSGATHALVLELVEGPTLADRINQGAIPLHEALPIARQIAEALEAAHEQGIIHRDLKPANIKIQGAWGPTPTRGTAAASSVASRPRVTDGTVKVLDFGLAKALQPPVVGPSFSSADPAADAAESPTMSLTAAATQMGMIMGTAAYMSPEQARGAAVDRRSDVWSFGVVLFEMLSGARLFDGETVSDTVAAVLREAPDERLLPADTPMSIRRLLRRCLERDRRKRLPDIGVARLEIDEALAEPEAVPVPTVAPTETRRPASSLALVLGGIALALIGGLVTWTLTRPAPPPAPKVMHLSIPLPEGSQTNDWTVDRLAISPDGMTVAYFDDALNVRRLDEDGWRRIQGTELGDTPFFSPDGEWIGFHRGTQLMKVPTAGGRSAVVSNRVPALFGASWAENDTIVFGDGSALSTVSASGGETDRVPLQDQRGATHPSFLPGGSTFVFSAFTSLADMDLVALSLETGERRLLIDGGARPRYLHTGHLVYFSESLPGVAAVPFDPDRLEVLGPGVSVLDGVRFDPGTGGLQFGVSRSGHVVFLPGREERTRRSLVWVDRAGGIEPIAAEAIRYQYPSLSPDGTRVAVSATTGEATRPDIWVVDLERTVATRLTFEAENGAPVWSPDGSRLVFTSVQDDADSVGSLNVRRADGAGTIERLNSTAVGQFPYVWSSTGQIIMAVLSQSFGLNIGSVDTGTPGEPVTLLGEPFGETRPDLSPDERWLAYTSDESGRNEIYVRPYPDVEGGKWQVSTAGGHSPVWIEEANELVYRGDGRMMSVAIDASDGFRPGTPTALFPDSFVDDIGGRSYDVTADGQRFLMIQESRRDSETNRIDIILNWAEEVKAKVPRP